MLDTIKGWLGQSAGISAEGNNKINIMDVHNAHIKCKVGFQEYLSSTPIEKLDSSLICRDNNCPLGKWIHGPAFGQFNQLGAFYTLRAAHAQLHFVAGRVVEKIQGKTITLEAASTDNEYVRVSRNLMKAITDLKKQIVN